MSLCLVILNIMFIIVQLKWQIHPTKTTDNIIITIDFRVQFTQNVHKIILLIIFKFNKTKMFFEQCDYVEYCTPKTSTNIVFIINRQIGIVECVK